MKCSRMGMPQQQLPKGSAQPPKPPKELIAVRRDLLLAVLVLELVAGAVAVTGSAELANQSARQGLVLD